jgi:DNA-binding NtrC family response regulator
VIAERRALIRDLGSKNGTSVDGVHVREAYLKAGSMLRLGATTVQFQLAAEMNRLPLTPRTTFGEMVGHSVAMRQVFWQLERAAASDATVLLDGETGTGKGQAAAAIHQESARAKGAFRVVDCGAIPENLLESELFGHERGAFTGATARRVGAFEEASGGTIFLDEIGELPLDLQPKLLRALESRDIRRVGSATSINVDVRIIAATNRDLRAEVNAGQFRADLYFRLAVVRVTMPALRQRPDDLPTLAETILQRLGADPEQRALLLESRFLDRLRHAAWPGNVRELRNFLERCLIYQDAALPLGEDEPAPARDDMKRRPFPEARDRALESFERDYLAELMAAHGGRMNAAAAAAGIGRVYLYKLLVRHGMK